MFRDDTRGQSVQVGVIILFSFAIIAFTSYQAVIVPQQNQEVEFQHSQEIEDDFVNLHSSMMNAANNGEIPFTDVQLGTNYPSRLFGLNPPPTRGVIETTEPQPMDSSDNLDLTAICPDGNVETRTLEYTANYNYLNTPPTLRIENAYAYRDYGDDTFRPANEEGDVEQQLVSDGRINLVALRNPDGRDEFRREGVGTTSIEMVPGQRGQTELTGETTVTVPTQLSQEWWRDTIPTDEITGIEPGDIVVTGGELSLTVPSGFTVSCTSVGIGGAPPGGEREATTSPGGDGPQSTVDIDEARIAEQDDGDSSTGPIRLDGETIVIDYQALDADQPNNDSPTVSLWADVQREGSSIENEFVDFRTIDNEIFSNIGPAASDSSGIARVDDVQVDRTEGETSLYAIIPNDSDSEQVRVELGGICRAYYTGFSGSADEASELGLDSQTPDRVDTSDISITPNQGDNFAYKFTGTITIEQAGNYQFQTTSDDGSWLYIDGEEIVDNGGNHGPELATGTKNLDAGTYDISIYYYENTGGQELSVSYNGPDTSNSNQEIPVDVLNPRYDGDVCAPGGAAGGNSGGQGSLPGGASGFNDANGNGQYDIGETTYTDEELFDFSDTSVDLVIERELNRQNGDINIEANSINARSRIRSGTGSVTLESSNDLSVTEVIAQNDDISMIAGGSINAQNGRIESGTGDIEMEASGDVQFDGTSIRAQNGDATIGINGGNQDLSVDGAVIRDSDSTLEVDANPSLNINGTPAEGTVERD